MRAPSQCTPRVERFLCQLPHLMLAAPVEQIGEEQGAARDEAVGEQADSAHDLRPDLGGEEGRGLGASVVPGLLEEAEGLWRDCKRTGPK